MYGKKFGGNVSARASEALAKEFEVATALLRVGHF